MAFLIWITGLSGSGKTTLAKKVYRKIKSNYPNTILLDGDDFRKITQQTYKHTREERLQIALQIAGMCKFLTDQEINVVCSTISLFREVQEFNRKNISYYYEIYVHCEMDELIKRDQKKIYSKALNKEIKNVVGIDITFDKPINSDLEINNTFQSNLDKNVNSIINLIKHLK